LVKEYTKLNKLIAMIVVENSMDIKDTLSKIELQET